MKFKPINAIDDPVLNFKVDPVFYTAMHMSNHNILYVFRELTRNVYQEIEVWIYDKNIIGKRKLTVSEQKFCEKNFI